MLKCINIPPLTCDADTSNGQGRKQNTRKESLKTDKTIQKKRQSQKGQNNVRYVSYFNFKKMFKDMRMIDERNIVKENGKGSQMTTDLEEVIKRNNMIKLKE